MEQKVLDHYLEFGMFTYPGLYADYFKSLPDNVREIGKLLRTNMVHRSTLKMGNGFTNKDLKFGDMEEMPWYRQPEDDNLPTTVAMVAELFRRDSRGLVLDRKVPDKLVLTCRYLAIMLVSILKTKGIPARVRSGFAGYWPWAKKAGDHWIVEYWKREENRWVVVDVDGSFHEVGFDLYDMPDGKFDYAADAWLDVREGKIPEKHFYNEGGYSGLITTGWALFYDFHCLMNNEIIYLHGPRMVDLRYFDRITEKQLREIDNLARLMKQPDENFDELLHLWNTKKEFRLVVGALL